MYNQIKRVLFNILGTVIIVAATIGGIYVMETNKLPDLQTFIAGTEQIKKYTDNLAMRIAVKQISVPTMTLTPEVPTTPTPAILETEDRYIEYRNSMFKLTYPSSWNISISNNSTEIAFRNKNVIMTFYLKNHPHIPDLSYVRVKDADPITIGGSNEILRYYTSPITQEQSAFVELNKEIALITITLTDDYINDGITKAKNILQTIKYQPLDNNNIFIASPLNVYKADSIPDNWKTYSPNSYNFELKYPSYWSVDETEMKALDLDKPKLDKNNIIINHRIAFGTPESYIPNTQTLRGEVIFETDSKDKYSEMNLDTIVYTSRGDIAASKVVKYKVGNIEAIEVHDIACPSNIDCIHVYVKYEKTLISIYSNSDDRRYINLPIIYQMLSSLTNKNGTTK